MRKGLEILQNVVVGPADGVRVRDEDGRALGRAHERRGRGAELSLRTVRSTKMNKQS